MNQIAEYAVSTAYLRPTQIYNRLRKVLRQRVLHNRPNFRSWYLRQANGDEPFRHMEFPYRRPSCPALIDDLDDHRFTFLNRTMQLGDPIDWTAPSQTRLWLYNLHYFDYVLELARAYEREGSDRAYLVFRRLVNDWIERCPVATSTIWDAYPTSLRVANWIKAYGPFAPAIQDDPSFAKRLRRSMYIQTLFLEQHLEYHLLNNHLLDNARTLLIAGYFFQDQNALRWREKGKRILWRGLRDNVLADGGHDERTPMYHQIMLDLYEDVETVFSRAGETAPDILSEKLCCMRQWLSDILHPDGQIPLLNDAALRIAREPSDCIRGVRPTSDGLTALADSGYFVFREQAKKHYLVFDAGSLGPDHQTAHGHCDTLSYELSLNGQRVIVDSGVSGYYGDLERRSYYRSTRAHNTVMVDGQEQSEIWDRFRVARRAKPIDVVWSGGNGSSSIAFAAASHTGYRRLKGSVIHRRWVCWIDQRFWVVCDRLSGRGHHVCDNMIHFHPDTRIIATPEMAKPGCVQIGDTTLQIVPWGYDHVSTCRGRTDPIQGWYAPEFGLNLENDVWVMSHSSRLPAWSGYVLWPESSEVSSNCTVIERSKCEINVNAENSRYRLHIDLNNVQMESW